MSRWSVIRRRVAPLIFVAGLGLLVYETCGKQQRTHASIVIDAGDAASRVDAIDAELIVKQASIGTFRRVRLPDADKIGPLRVETSLPAEDGELKIDVTLRGGEHRKLSRSFHAVEGGTITVPIAADLR